VPVGELECRGLEHVQNKTVAVTPSSLVGRMSLFCCSYAENTPVADDGASNMEGFELNVKLSRAGAPQALRRASPKRSEGGQANPLDASVFSKHGVERRVRAGMAAEVHDPAREGKQNDERRAHERHEER
jgi:hypothetical protein